MKRKILSYTALFFVISVNNSFADSLSELYYQPEQGLYQSLLKDVSVYESREAFIDEWMEYNNDKPIVEGLIDNLKTARIGDSDQIVVKVRKRLDLLGVLPYVDTQFFDPELEQAIKQTQKKYGLSPDGVIARTYLFNLFNEPAKKEALKSDYLETFYKISNDVKSDTDPNNKFIIVNIPSAQLKMYDLSKSDNPILESEVVVGRSARPTPLMKTVMVGIKYNPDWTPPKTVLENDIFPHLGLQDQSYIKNHELKLYDQNGIELDPSKVSKEEYILNKYKFIQSPGINNPLGVLKFETSNSYNIYLHDTNSKFLFTDNDRQYSSGCIRVKKFLDLANIVTDKSKDEIKSNIKTSITYIDPITPIPIYITYNMYDIVNGNSIIFPDVYGIRGYKPNKDEELSQDQPSPTIIKKNEIKVSRLAGLYGNNYNISYINKYAEAQPPTQPEDRNKYITASAPDTSSINNLKGIPVKNIEPTIVAVNTPKKEIIPEDRNKYITVSAPDTSSINNLKGIPVKNIEPTIVAVNTPKKEIIPEDRNKYITVSAPDTSSINNLKGIPVKNIEPTIVAVNTPKKEIIPEDRNKYITASAPDTSSINNLKGIPVKNIEPTIVAVNTPKKEIIPEDRNKYITVSAPDTSSINNLKGIPVKNLLASVEAINVVINNQTKPTTIPITNKNNSNKINNSNQIKINIYNDEGQTTNQNIQSNQSIKIKKVASKEELETIFGDDEIIF